MKIADVQILFYAIDPTANQHATAARWFEDAIIAREPVGLAWPTVHQFLRLGTNLAFTGYMRDDEAMGWIEEWAEAGVEIIADSDLTWNRSIRAAFRRDSRARPAPSS